MRSIAQLRRIFFIAAPVLLCVAGAGRAQEPTRAVVAPQVEFVDQGWTAAERDVFYTTSQGSLMMPYVWFKALRRLDVDEPFAGDQLQRYGYLPNATSRTNPQGLPVGFVITGNATSGDLGMTCAACHTAQLEYQKDGVTRAIRLDGAPANADFQQFLTDLTAASRATLAQPDRFTTFAKSVLGSRYSVTAAAKLRTDFSAWLTPFGEFMDKSLPPKPWGPGRLDAFGMIFNRVAGLDLEIPSNIKIADAPVSYPFLWNASRQDRTQWNGGVPNGLYIQGLGRNTGEVFGVFAKFKPRRITPPIGPVPPQISHLNNSAYFPGLQSLEEKIAKLRPPPWPKEIFGYDAALAGQGETLFRTNCQGCHSEQRSTEVPVDAWVTPVKAVGTDAKMAINAERVVNPGILKGSIVPVPPFTERLGQQSKAHDVLAVTVVGALVDRARADLVDVRNSGVWRALRLDMSNIVPDERIDLRRIAQVHDFIRAKLGGLFRPPAAATGAAYESRVLHGIWATAPYLHNGSVPNLWELLKPANQRITNFKVGSRKFDPKNVGYVTDESPFQNGVFVTGPSDANGNANGGHEYGTNLSEAERWAIVEYLKGL